MTAPPPSLGLQIRQHCLACCESLHVHHTSEDQGAFPALAQKFPHLTPALERLRAGHHTVDRIRGELEALLADLATADADRFRAELSRMTDGSSAPRLPGGSADPVTVRHARALARGFTARRAPSARARVSSSSRSSTSISARGQAAT